MFHTPRYISIIDYFLSRNVHTFYSRLIVGERYKLFLISIFFSRKGRGEKGVRCMTLNVMTKCYVCNFRDFRERVFIYVCTCIYVHIKVYWKQRKLWGCKLYIFYIERDGSVEWKCLFTKPSVDLNPRNDDRRFRRSNNHLFWSSRVINYYILASD